MDHVIAPSTLFLNAELAGEVRARFGTPCYVYDRRALESAAASPSCPFQSGQPRQGGTLSRVSY